MKTGNDSVFGLIDWDKKNEHEDRIVVLAHNRRYAIENCLLDPLLVAALVIRECKNRELHIEIGLNESECYRDLDSMPSERYQIFVNKIQTKVLGLETESNLIKVEYKGGFSLHVAEQYLQIQGHELEKRVKQIVYPCSKQFNNTETLLSHIIETILRENPKFLPMELEECLSKLLS